MPDPAHRDSSLTVSGLSLALAKALALALSFALPLLLVRRLAQGEFGLYKQVVLVVNTAVAILPLGFATSAPYFFSRFPTKRAQVVLNILLVYMFVAAVVCLTIAGFPNTLAVLFNANDLADYAPSIGLVILLWVGSSFFELIAIAHHDLRRAKLYIVTAQLAKTLLFFGAALLFGSLRALINAALVFGVLQTAALLVYLRSRFPGFWRVADWHVMRAQLAYALPLGVAGLLYAFQMDLHQYVVANRFGPAAFAIYAIGSFQLPIVGILNESFGSVMIPRVAYLRTIDAVRPIVLLLARMMRNLAMLYLPLTVFLLVTGREFVTVLFTAQYLASWPIFLVNLVLIPLGILACACDAVFRAHPEHLHFLVKSRIVLIVFLAGGLAVGTRYFGLVGAAGAVVGVNVIERLIVAFKAGSVLGVSRYDLPLLKDIGKLTLAAASAGVGTGAVRWLMGGRDAGIVLVVCAAVFTMAYAVCVLMLSVFGPEERLAVQERIAFWQRWGWYRRIPRPVVLRDE